MALEGAGLPDLVLLLLHQVLQHAQLEGAVSLCVIFLFPSQGAGAFQVCLELDQLRLGMPAPLGCVLRKPDGFLQLLL